MEKSIRPDPKYFTKVLWILITISGSVIFLGALVHLIVFLAGGKLTPVMIMWLVIGILLILMWIITTPVSYLWIKNLSYTIHSDVIRIHKGIMTKTQQNIPFRAITDFAQVRSLFDRFLGIGSIKIQTAGQSQTPTGYEGTLGGLVQYEAWYSDLRERLKMLLPVSESVTTVERNNRQDVDYLREILSELKTIRELLNKAD